MATVALRGVFRTLTGPADGSDGDLLGRFVSAADGEAFAELVRRHGPTVLGVCRRALGNGPDADDAFQATFLVLVRKARSVRPRGQVGGYLYGVAVRVAAHVRVARARRLARHRGLSDMPDPRATESTGNDLAGVVDAELARLPEAFRSAVVLCELEGLSLKAAAARLGVPAGTVASRLARGRRLLAGRLRGKGFALGGLAGAVVPGRVLAAAAGLAAGGAAGPVSTLTDGVLKTMLAYKLKGLGRAAVAVTLGVLGAAALFGPAAASAPPREPAQPVVRRAPVKPEPAATEKQLDEWWADLQKDEQTATRAVLALSARPKEAAPFLKAKLRPLKVGEDQVRKWLADLGSDKEDVWKPAFEAMTYLDPRLAIGLEALMTEVTESPARTRLVGVLTGYGPDTYADARVELMRSGDGFNFQVAKVNPDPKDGTGGKYATWAEHRVDTLDGDGWHGNKKGWTRAVRAVVLLEHLGTPDARDLLKLMATGHPDAKPTKAARDALARLGEKAR